MRPYWALFRARARTLLQYRVAALAGIATQWVFGFVMISVLIAFYQGASGPQPMTLAQTITYTWLGQAMLGTLPWSVDRETHESIRSGAVAYDLARPIGLYAYWFARTFAQKTAPTLLKSIPMFVIATFLLPARYAMQWPPLAGLLAWLLAVGGTLMLSCAITLVMQASLFWTVSGDGISRILPSFATLLSGMIIPLPLMPDQLQTFLKYQPFAGITSLPSLLFCGVLPPGAVLETLALQLFWTLVFVLIGWTLLQKGLTRLDVAGG